MSVHKRSLVPVLMMCLVLAGVVAFSPRAAQACMVDVECYLTPDGWICFGGSQSGLASPPDVTVKMLSNNRAQIKVGHYVTPEMSRTYDCSVAVAPIPGVERVNRITLVDSWTGRRLPNYSFLRNNAANAEYVKLLSDIGMSAAPAQDWQGFSTSVLGGSRGGIVHSFLLDVTLKPGITPEQLHKAVRQNGMLVNGSANPDGTLDFGHYHLRSLGSGGLTVVVPNPQR